MGGSVGDALSAVTKPLEQDAKTATDAVGATPLGGLMGATPVGKMLEGENPLDSPLLSPAVHSLYLTLTLEPLPILQLRGSQLPSSSLSLLINLGAGLVNPGP